MTEKMLLACRSTTAACSRSAVSAQQLQSPDTRLAPMATCLGGAHRVQKNASLPGFLGCKDPKAMQQRPGWPP